MFASFTFPASMHNAAECYQQLWGGGGGEWGCRQVFKYARYPLFMFGLRNAALQSALGRPGELIFLDLVFVLLASSRDPNFTGRHLF
jgi:hypothetical protein